MRKPITQFTTHEGETVTGERLQAVLNTVAENYRKQAQAVRKEDAYAAHVTEERKDSILARDLAYADEIQHGVVRGLTVAQQINYEITGKSIALLP